MATKQMGFAIGPMEVVGLTLLASTLWPAVLMLVTLALAS
jgi:hypothetical protein